MRRAAALLLALAACGPAGAGDAAPMAVVLFDVSRSTVVARDAYLDELARVLEGLSATGGTVLGDVIDDNPLVHSSFPIRAELPPDEGLGGNPLVREREVERVIREALDEADVLLDGVAEERGTSILDGLAVAERGLAGAGGTRYLVVLSDMLEVSPRVTLAKDALEPKAVAAFIEAEREAGRLPDLAGVSVYVAGAGGGSISGERYQRIEAFWRTYLDATGATVVDYGPSLLDFPERGGAA